MISGHTRLTGLIGWPVTHSLSPAMHNAAFEALGLNWCYVALPVRAENLAAAVAGLGALGFAGANVTVPHKEAVLPHLQHVSPDVRALGAANTLAVREDEAGRPVLLGLNTDHTGLIQALRDASVEPLGCRALVLGAGGAARAVVYGLMGAGATSIAVLNRSAERAEALIAGLAAANRESVLSAGPLTPSALGELAAAATLLVNATTLGLEPAAEESPWPAGLLLPAHLAVLDLVYRPHRTRLLAQAEAAGAQPISGLGMLIHQAAQAFEIWTGEKAPIEVMRQACETETVMHGP
jgi:shikimate dehydrogenase